MVTIVDGRALRDKILTHLKEKISTQNLSPKLVIFLIGNDERSLAYIKQKEKAAQGIGAQVELIQTSENIEQENLENKITEKNNEKETDGIIVQLPLPRHLDQEKIFSKISKIKDVDGLIEGSPYQQATPVGILEILREYKLDFRGKKVVVLGSSGFVGKPLVALLREKGAEVIEIDENTPRPYDYLVQQGSIVVSAVGKAGLVTAVMVKDGAAVLDAGINVASDGKLVGDVAFDEVSQKASLITPVPGGVGPMTVAMLMKNLVSAAEMHSRNQTSTS